MKIIIGGIIKKENKYLLVKEIKKECCGMYNIPAGHLEENELLIECALREIKEETGYDVNITNVVQIGNTKNMISVIFLCEITSAQNDYNKEEALPTVWMTYEEIINSKEKLRAQNLIIEAIKSVEENKLFSLDIIKY